MCIITSVILPTILFVRNKHIFKSMNKKIIVLILLVLPILSFAQTKVKKINILFSGQIDSVSYDVTLLNYPQFVSDDPEFFSVYYKTMNNRLYDFLLEDLQRIKKEKKLNDLLYYFLVRTATDSIFKSVKKEEEKTMFNWFMLTKSGYDIRIEIFKRKPTLHAFTDDAIYNWQVSKTTGGNYVDITKFHNDLNYEKYDAKRVAYHPIQIKDAKPFKFSFTEMPLIFKEAPVARSINFTYNENKYTIEYTVDTNYVNFIKDYVDFGLNEHARLPLSKGCSDTFLSWFKEQASNMTEEEIARFILSFVRTGFKHLDDEKLMNGGRKIDSPEEMLFKKITDNEDRAVLFSYLAKEVLGIDVLIIRNLNMYQIALPLGVKEGQKPILVNNVKYAYCDIDDTSDKLNIGEYKPTDEKKIFKLIEQ